MSNDSCVLQGRKPSVFIDFCCDDIQGLNGLPSSGAAVGEQISTSGS